MIGRGNVDVSVFQYEKRLEDDWFDDLDDLKVMSVDDLSRYALEAYAKAILPSSDSGYWVLRVKRDRRNDTPKTWSFRALKK